MMAPKISGTIVLRWKIKNRTAIFEVEKTEISGSNEFLFISVSQIVTWGLPKIESPEALVKLYRFLGPAPEPLNQTFQGDGIPRF